MKPYVFPEIEDLAWFVSAEPAKKAYAAKEYETALRLYEELAEKGFARAQFECGWMYYNGKGTPPNLEAALRWFEKAAALEHKDAQFRCAQMYYNGEGTAPNQAKALHWYEKAAMQGHKDAQFECGKLYHHGKGVAHDMGKASRMTWEKRWIGFKRLRSKAL
nr:tetratricopeptide repeat protein [uncultured Acetatifactor sp.]